MNVVNALYLATHPEFAQNLLADLDERRKEARKEARRNILKQYDKAYVLSIKPKYAKMIYEGRKNWEFRKAPPPICKPMYIYESAPVSAVTGVLIFSFEVKGYVDDVYQLAKYNKLWTRNLPGITVSDLEDYCRGNPVVSALRVAEARKFDQPGSLGFKPPQNWGSFLTKKDEAES